ncbi:alpha/beta hydrolase [bacterium]|nr:alpha/beta hydrolase [bacterium]
MYRVIRRVACCGILLAGILLWGRYVLEASEPETIRLKTLDQIEIQAAWYHGDTLGKGNSQLLVIAPGFAQHPRTRSMRLLAQALEPYFDVVVISFRGNQGSQGRYSFGAKEVIDLQALIDWARTRYTRVSLLGLSLGAYSAYLYCALMPGTVSELFLVSCPPSVETVVTSGAAFLNPLIILFRETAYVHEPENDVFFKWDWPFIQKNNLVLIGDKVTIPSHFLVGQKDTLVYPALTKKVFTATQGPKTWLEVKAGLHAEHMFHQDPAFFINWILNHRQVVEESKK